MHRVATAAVVRGYRSDDEAAVVALWRACGLVRDWNDPHRDIARKLADDAGPFFVAEQGGFVVGTAMAGYDGHRGWIHYLAVSDSVRGCGLGRRLVEHAERWLLARGCPKVNLMVRGTNQDVIGFYGRLGYARDDVVSLGKRLIDDTPSPRQTRKDTS